MAVTGATGFTRLSIGAVTTNVEPLSAATSNRDVGNALAADDLVVRER